MLYERRNQLNCCHRPTVDALLAILDAGPISPADLAFMSDRRRHTALLSIDSLIATLDTLEVDPDLEDGGDTEPNCGDFGAYVLIDECEPDGEEGSLGFLENVSDQRLALQGSRDDREEVNEDGGDINDEPHDEELDGDKSDYEPELGWPEGILQNPSAGAGAEHQEQDGWRRPRHRRIYETTSPSEAASDVVSDLHRRGHLSRTQVVPFVPYWHGGMLVAGAVT